MKNRECPLLVVAVAHMPLDAAARQRIRDMASGHRVVLACDEEDVAAAAPVMEILVGSAYLNRAREAPRLRWVQLWSTGADELWQWPALPRTGVRITNLRGVHSGPVSEHVCALILAQARNLPRLIRDQDRRRWTDPKTLHFRELPGATLVVAGTGAVGRAVACKARAFGMRTIGIRRRPEQAAPEFDEVRGTSDIQMAFAKADWAVLALPLTPETRGLIGPRELRALPERAYLINVGRGAVLDEAALQAALREGWFAGAALDVLTDEPLDPKSDLWQSPNLVLTPHCSGDGGGDLERSLQVLSRNYALFMENRTLINAVDPEVGY